MKYEQIKQSHLFREDAMSGRGHIWNNTLPLVVKHIFVGSGANTYMFEYPQNDYIGRAYIYGQNTFDVKAHCWYLQQCVENGVLGLGMAVNRMIVEKEKMFQKSVPDEEDLLPVFQANNISTDAKRKNGKKKSRRERKGSKKK